MKGNFIDEISSIQYREAPWCNTCLRRNTCTIKDSVSSEFNAISPYPLKYLRVTVMCEGYVKNIKLPNDSKGVLNSIFIK